MLKRFVSSALALCLVFGGAAMLPEGAVELGSQISASAESYGDYEYTVLKDGTVEISKYNGKDTKVTIPSKINGKLVTSIGELSFGRCTNIKSVTIPDGIITIENAAFVGAESLESVKLPSTLKEISSNAFAFTALKKVTIPKNVTSIGDFAFNGIGSLREMVIYENAKNLGMNSVGYYHYTDENGAGHKNATNTNLTIYCPKGSAAEKYAKDNGLKYSAIQTSIKNAAVTNIKNRHYTGKALTQSPVVKVGGKTLKAGTDYTLSYKNNTKIGTATVTIKGKGKYSGSVSKTFKVCPPKTTLKSASSPAKGKLKVKYTKEKNATAYQITYSTSSSFAKSKTASKSSAKLTKTISGLKSGKTYYVKVRTYKTVSGKRIYSGYSAVKKVKVK